MIAMLTSPPLIEAHERSVEVHLLGTVDFDACLTLQQRLVYDAAHRSDGRITLLACEHPPLVTIGRQGSRGHIRLGDDELRRRGLELRWVNRGGGCVLHGPGQIALYPIVPLSACGFTVGGYLDRLQAGLVAALVELGVAIRTRDARYGAWGRVGQVAMLGAAVKDWVSYHGAFVNVHTPPGVGRFIVADESDNAAMSSLAAERQRPLRTPTVREALVRHVAAALGTGRYHLFTGHPWLARPRTPAREVARRVG